jgi:5-methylcytosine-specific restriction endonuclease McrA
MRTGYNQYMKEYLKSRYDERRAIAIRILGGRCVICNSTKDLQFDHIHNEQKSFDIADKLAQFAWSRILDELQKCQLLCFNCHVDKSAIEASERQRARYAASRLAGDQP